MNAPYLRDAEGQQRRLLAGVTAVIMVASVFALAVIPARGARASAPPDARVSIQHVSYVPDQLTVPVGTTVTWRNDETDGTTHSVTGAGLDSPDLSPGQVYSYRFASPGTFIYHCRFHSYMQGSVTVTDEQTTTTTAPPSSTTTAPPASTTSTTAAPPPPPPPSAGTPLGDGTYLAPYDTDGNVKVFHLDMAPTKWEVKPGDTRDAYAFNGVIPGPVLRVNEGDRVRFIVKNDLPEPTSVHWHGMELPNDQDGVPDITQPPIQPGQTYTYEWTAVSTGTHWYHSHMGGPQVGKGLYGALEVVPKTGEIPADHDYRIMVGDQNLGFVFNGKSYPATVPLKAKVGDRVHIRLFGAGDDEHPIHIHGQPFQVLAQDGNPLPVPITMDTLLVNPGQTFDILVKPVAPGKWLLHCHKFSHSETMSGMSGLVTMLDVSP